MKILLNNNDLNEALNNVSNLGFVPTMGSLHKGHISLIKRSKKVCNQTIVSIYVNPKQFNNKKDFKNYPRNKKRDLSILKKLKVNFVYLPKYKYIYDFNRKLKIELNKKDNILCAKFRKGHFEGVIDIMDRLVQKIKPKKIFMGEKDLQQLHLVKKYLEKKYNCKIIKCKTIRDRHKLALSSRNLHLNRMELNLARKFTQELILLKKKSLKIRNLKKFLYSQKKEFIKKYNIKIEYLELRNESNLKISNKIKNSKILVAYYINKIRLIDNL